MMNVGEESIRDSYTCSVSSNNFNILPGFIESVTKPQCLVTLSISPGMFIVYSV